MTRNWRYGKYAIGTLLAFSFVLSALSNLDCQFVIVDIGFEPQNIYNEEPKFSTTGIGIWTIEDVDRKGNCIAPMFSKSYGSLTSKDDLYTSALLTSDRIFTAMRFLALFGMLFALSNLILTWVSIFRVFKYGSGRSLHLALISFVCEGSKLGLIFASSPCAGKKFWESVDIDFVSTFHCADQCYASRGSYMSVTSIILIGMHVLLSLLSQDYSNAIQGENDDFDNVTLPSFLNSLGESIVSKFSSSTGSKYSRSQGSSESKNNSHSNSQNSNRTSGQSPASLPIIVENGAQSDSNICSMSSRLHH